MADGSLRSDASAKIAIVLWQTPVVGELVMVPGTTAKSHKQLVEAGMLDAVADNEAP